jgi:hypothetical protein
MSKDELLKSFRKQLADVRDLQAKAQAKENQLLGAIFALEQLPSAAPAVQANGHVEEPIAAGSPD